MFFLYHRFTCVHFMCPVLKFQLFAVPLSLDNIYEEVMKNEVGRSMTLDRVEASLAALGCPGMDDYKISMFTHCRFPNVFTFHTSEWV